jgi:ferritin-like metal-binding protein YciE
VLWIERMLAFQVLPKLRDAAGDDELRAAFEEHLLETRRHAETVERVFEAVGSHPSPIYDPAMSSLASQHDELAEKIVSDGLRDVFHADAAARTEHLELAAYESLLGLADVVDGDVKKPLEQNRDDESQALKKVEKIASRLRKDAVS